MEPSQTTPAGHAGKCNMPCHKDLCCDVHKAGCPTGFFSPTTSAARCPTTVLLNKDSTRKEEVKQSAAAAFEDE